MIPLIIIFVIMLLAALLFISYYRCRDSELSSLSGPYSYPFLGILPHFANKNRIFEKISEFHQTYGKSFKGYRLGHMNIFTIDEDFIEFLLKNTKSVRKSNDLYKFIRWLGFGLLTSEGEKWRQRRKMITPAFHLKVLEKFITVFEKNCNIMLLKLQQEVGKSHSDISHLVKLCSLDNICETAMGTRINAQLNNESEYLKATVEMNRIFTVRSYNVLKGNDLTYILTQDYWTERKALKVLHGFTLELIKSRREELLRIEREEINRVKNEDYEEINIKDNLLDLLLKANCDDKPLRDEDIREEVDTFTFAGHDTTSSGASFALLLISNYPDVQERLLEEQRKIFGDNPQRPTTLADLHEMKYMEMVIKETLRLFPPVPLISRAITEDVYYNDWFLRKGYQIKIFILGLHRNPECYPEPTKFIPERFDPKKESTRHPCSYIPFSTGRRNCIGQKFAMLEMKLIIGKVLRNFKLLHLIPKHEPEICSETILRSGNGVLMKLQKRAW